MIANIDMFLTEADERAIDELAQDIQSKQDKILNVRDLIPNPFHSFYQVFENFGIPSRLIKNMFKPEEYGIIKFANRNAKRVEKKPHSIVTVIQEYILSIKDKTIYFVGTLAEVLYESIKVNASNKLMRTALFLITIAGIVNSLVNYVFSNTINSKTADIITATVSAPLVEEAGRFYMEKTYKAGWLYTHLLNMQEFSDYVRSMVSDGVSLKSAMLVRILAASMHSFNNILISLFTKLGYPKVGYISAVISHMIWNGFLGGEIIKMIPLYDKQDRRIKVQ